MKLPLTKGLRIFFILDLFFIACCLRTNTQLLTRSKLFLQDTSKPKYSVENEILPITVISGYSNAGKTSVLNNILNINQNKWKCAVILNNLSPLNINGKFIQPLGDTDISELSDGIMYCAIQKDLIREVGNLAIQKKYDSLLIENDGLSESLPLAEALTFDNHIFNKKKGERKAKRTPLSSLVKIENMVTVVDASTFLDHMKDASDVDTDDGDTRTITDIIVSQIEFATVIIVNKCDLVTPEHLLQVKQMIKSLNYDAKIIESIHGNIDTKDLMTSSSCFDFDTVSDAATWSKLMNDDSLCKEMSTDDNYGVSAFVFRARRPFHPKRLYDFITTYLGNQEEEDDNDDDDDEKDDAVSSIKNTIENKSNSTLIKQLPTILRSKGFFWLASRYTENLIWGQAGGLFRITPGGSWWIDTPREYWPTEEGMTEQIEADFIDKEIGDRRQEIVFIGANMNTTQVKQVLDSCLLTDIEMKESQEIWSTYDDPFPPTEFDSDEHDHTHDHDHHDHSHNHNHDHDHHECCDEEDDDCDGEKFDAEKSGIDIEML